MATSGDATSPLKELGPATSTPARRPLSVRRTTTHDSLRPEGLLGRVFLTGRGRDLYTGKSGQSNILGSALLQTEVEYLPERTISTITLDPPHRGLSQLVGVSASVGFRRLVDEAMPGERESGSVRYQLLDDLPTALLVSGYAIKASEVSVQRPGPMLQFPDMCAGYVTGGTILSGMTEGMRPPPHKGPLAPVVDPVEDPLGWHDMDRLPAHGMRRRRRLDVWEEKDLTVVECFFRDSHVDAQGVETIVHEYTVHATVDPMTLRFASCEATMGALPYPECPTAAASAGRLVGAPVGGLRRWVRDTFTGPTTCTHLNDTMRALEDVGALLGALHTTSTPRFRPLR